MVEVGSRSVGGKQEGLHSIKVKKIKSLVLKLDLIKAYDRLVGIFLDWFCSKLVLVWRQLIGLWVVQLLQILQC